VANSPADTDAASHLVDGEKGKDVLLNREKKKKGSSSAPAGEGEGEATRSGL